MSDPSDPSNCNNPFITQNPMGQDTSDWNGSEQMVFWFSDQLDQSYHWSKCQVSKQIVS